MQRSSSRVLESLPSLEMGRALRVSKSFPSIITSTRLLSSGEKLSCISSSADSYGCSPSDSSDGELPPHYRTYHKVGSAHFLPGRRFPVMGQERIPRFFSYRRVYCLPARFCSSGAEFSESEWPETDVEEVQRGRQDASETDRDEAYVTEEETDAETGPRNERNGVHREDTSRKSRLYGKDHGPDRLYSRDVHLDRLHGRDRGLDKSHSKEKRFREDGSSSKYIRDSDSDYVEVESDLEGELQEEIERQMAAEPKFKRPSITWGILLTSDLRRKARDTVIKYLDSEGINTSELTRIELPTTVEVMQTRLGFLRKIGLDNDAINSYPLVLGCSVQKNMVPVLKYLKKIGITDRFLISLLRKYPMILHVSVVIDILPVYYFLRGLDIAALDIPSVLTRYPDVLGFKTDGTMSTSVAYLVSLGVNTRNVGHMLTEYPEILGMRVAVVIKPKVDYLMSLGIPQLIVAKILERRPYILGYDLEQRMQYNVNQLLNIGVHQEAIPGMVAQFPELLGRVIKTTLESQVDWFKGHLEMDSDGVVRFFETMPQAIFMHTEVAEERIRFLQSLRFTIKEIGIMVAQCPQILVSSIRESLRPTIVFLTRELKRPRQEVVDFPACLTYDLETRIKPRLKALGDTGTEWSLEWLLNCSDGEFKKRVSAGFVGEEDTEHVFAMGGKLPGRLAKDENQWQPAEQPREQRRFAF